MSITDVEIIINYIVWNGSETINKDVIALNLNKNERTVREALYTMNERGWIVCDRPNGDYLIVDKSNVDKYRDEVVATIKEQRARAMSSIVRYNRMIKALPEEYQEQFKEVLQ